MSSAPAKNETGELVNGQVEGQAAKNGEKNADDAGRS
jgi:hypothetical protein